MFLIIKKCEEVDASPFTHLPAHIKTLKEVDDSLKEVDDSLLRLKNYRAIIILGGDGTILRLIQQYKDLPPIIPVNYGTLGFLTTFSKNDFLNTKANFNLPEMYSIKRNRLLLNNKIYFLNETVITSRNRRLNKFNISIKNKIKDFKVRGDSLIISTMTGSTAYNHSIMGPTLLSDECFVINVVAPCKSHFRPLVCSILDELEVTCEGAICLVDGKEYDFDRVSVKWDKNFVTFLSNRPVNNTEDVINLMINK